jgi:peptidoglycan/LPS O-acetylase OafA/YrhL
VQNFLFSSLGHFGPSALTPTWSLAIEEQFYIIIPLLIYILSTKRLIQICLLFIIISPIFRSNASNWYMEYTHFIGRVDTLFLGVVLAVMKKEGRHYIKIFYSKYFIFFLFVTLISIYLFVSKSINHTIISFGFFYIVLYSFDYNQKNIISKLLFSPMLSFVGKLSFFIYLFHQLINGLFFYFMQKGQVPNLNTLQSYLIEITSISFTIYLAYLSSIYYEGLFIKYGQKFKFSK